MFRLRVLTDVHPRSKNGQPAQSTTGVARRSWRSRFSRGGMAATSPGATIAPISRTRSGTVRTTATMKRRFMSTSSGFGASSSEIVRGSSAIPQIGHEPGPGRTISGCIGHVYSTPLPAGAARAPPIPSPRDRRPTDISPGPGGTSRGSPRCRRSSSSPRETVECFVRAGSTSMPQTRSFTVSGGGEEGSVGRFIGSIMPALPATRAASRGCRRPGRRGAPARTT